MVIPLVAGVLALATPPLAQPVDPHLLWQLGKRDSTYAEFAVAGNYGAYAARFKRDPVARIGTQSPEQQWPFIHPGPGDAWAGSRAHRFRIEFTAGDIRGPVCRLTIGMVNTHNAAAPVLVVSINGRTQYRYDLPTGAPDASLTDPKQGRPTSLAIPFPAGLLRRGRNAIELSVVSGSWLLYDYLALEDGLDAPRGPVLTDLNATSTMLFRRK
ncbi:MAG: hypothetical protein FJX72_13450, partial [Armatimonadetes bacterium]|nr:hypothetical protein [Armatimonadota bacterium]